MKKFAKFLSAMMALAALATIMMAAAMEIAVTGITLPESLTLIEDQSATLNAGFTVDKEEATPEEIAEAASKLTLEWSSSDESVATVGQDGVVTGINFGTATITVSVDGTELSASTSVEVKPVLEALEVPALIELTINAKTGEALNSVLTPANAPVELTYISSDENVATVDANGFVTAVGNGSCLIITDNKYGIAGTTIVNVNTAPSGLALTDKALTIGDTAVIELAVEGENITAGLDFIYTSSDDSIVTVSEDGQSAKANGIGVATITVTNEFGQSASCTVTVKNVVCTYCGQEGHIANNCPTKAADEAAAAQKAAEEVAAAQRAAEEMVELPENGTPLAGPAPAPVPAPNHGAFGEIPEGCGSGSMCPEL